MSQKNIIFPDIMQSFDPNTAVEAVSSMAPCGGLAIILPPPTL